MTDDEIKELWLKLLNAKSYDEAFGLLRKAIPTVWDEPHQDRPERIAK